MMTKQRQVTINYNGWEGSDKNFCIDFITEDRHDLRGTSKVEKVQLATYDPDHHLNVSIARFNYCFSTDEALTLRDLLLDIYPLVDYPIPRKFKVELKDCTPADIKFLEKNLHSRIASISSYAEGED